MNAFPQPKAVPALRWQWPLVLTEYDRTPALSSAEQHSLAAFAQAQAANICHGLARYKQPLGRLIRPLDDVATVAGIPHARWRTQVHRLLREMHARGTSYWAWTADEWIELIESDQTGNYRHAMIVTSYLLCGFRDLIALKHLHIRRLAQHIFGQEPVQAAIQRVQSVLKGWGYGNHHDTTLTLCMILLANESPFLEEVTPEKLLFIRSHCLHPYQQEFIAALSRVLVHLALLDEPLTFSASGSERRQRVITLDGIAPEWVAWCDRWYETATLRHHTRQGIRSVLLRVGRWLATLHPDIIEPQQWTRALAAEAVAAVLRLRVGDWVLTTQPVRHMGKEMTAPTKAAYIYALRTFFRDVQAWEWIKPHFDPLRCFATPRTVLRGIGSNPRIIADDMWAKLLAAGMNLTSADLPGSASGRTGRPQQYPLEMVRAVALVWLFTGLRSDEIRRLRLGCVRWQPSGTPSPESGARPPQDAICLLDVPVNKTSPAFTKPVDRYAGLAIAAWEQVRPVQLPHIDPKTNEQVQMLFSYRNRPIGAPYVNATIIPMLCRKAGVPEADARGRITSHRARSTIASQLYNAAEPLTLEELQAWLGIGHLTQPSTMRRLRPPSWPSRWPMPAILSATYAPLRC